jgi:peptidoglycan L-alanyl-D-glutamate endopeptidase CwlK
MATKLIIAIWQLAAITMANTGLGQQPDAIIDSELGREAAMEGLAPGCPDEIVERQEVFAVEYYSFDGRLHRGQVVLDKSLVQDVREVFKLAVALKFPIESVIPISAPQFRKDGRWDDDLSMEANNTSAFNYRLKTGGGSLSNHALGYAIDINPRTNPYIKGETVLPAGAIYDPESPGTLTSHHAIVLEFKKRGWTWGGDWQSLKDYQHFEKPPQTAEVAK